MVLKGTEKDEAVLCTANKTFSLKKVETSNTGNPLYSSLHLLLFSHDSLPHSSCPFLFLFLLFHSTIPHHRPITRILRGDYNSPSANLPSTLSLCLYSDFQVRPRPKNPLETAHRLRETLLSCEGHRSLPSLLAAFPLSEGEIRELLPAIGAFASSSSSSLMSEEQLEVFPREALFDGYLQLLSGIVASGLSLAKIPSNFCEETSKIRPPLSTLLARNLQTSSSSSHDGEERIEFNAERVIRLGALLTILRYPHRVRALLFCLSSFNSFPFLSGSRKGEISNRMECNNSRGGSRFSKCGYPERSLTREENREKSDLL